MIKPIMGHFIMFTMKHKEIHKNINRFMEDQVSYQKKNCMVFRPFRILKLRMRESRPGCQNHLQSLCCSHCFRNTTVQNANHPHQLVEKGHPCPLFACERSSCSPIHPSNTASLQAKFTLGPRGLQPARDTSLHTSNDCFATRSLSFVQLLLPASPPPPLPAQVTSTSLWTWLSLRSSKKLA